jgi:hypothetical protein
MDSDDYESRSEDLNTVFDDNEELKEQFDDVLESNTCELTLQFERVLDLSEEELKFITPPAFYDHFMEIARGDMEDPLYFDYPSGDVTWSPRVNDMISVLCTSDKYTKIKDVIDKFMCGHFIDRPRDKLKGISSIFYDSVDLAELHGEICKAKYKTAKFRVYAVLQMEKWLYNDVLRKLKHTKKYLKTTKSDVMQKLKLSMLYANRRLF